jgi:hypothetical protein
VETGEPFRTLHHPQRRWRKTLQSLKVRYRRPYTARETSVSWNLMAGKNPLWVAKQHGHSIATMLRACMRHGPRGLRKSPGTIRRSRRKSHFVSSVEERCGVGTVLSQPGGTQRTRPVLGMLLVEWGCSAVAIGSVCLLPPRSSGGAQVTLPWLRFYIPLRLLPSTGITRLHR